MDWLSFCAKLQIAVCIDSRRTLMLSDNVRLSTSHRSIRSLFKFTSTHIGRHLLTNSKFLDLLKLKIPAQLWYLRHGGLNSRSDSFLVSARKPSPLGLGLKNFCWVCSGPALNNSARSLCGRVNQRTLNRHISQYRQEQSWPQAMAGLDLSDMARDS